MRHRCPTPLVVLAITLAVLGLSAFAFFWFIPTVIIRAYHGESLAALNALIRGQATHPVDEYLHDWHDLALAILVQEAALGMILAVLTWSAFQRFVDARLGPPPPVNRFVMSARRRATISAVVLLLVGMQIYDIARQQAHWPFSNYSMYSGVQQGTMWWFRIAGVTRDREVWLVPEEQLRPFDSVRIAYAFQNLVLDQPDAAVNLELRNLYELYEAGRRSGAHGGPRLLALRLYRLEWRLDPSLANKNTPEKIEPLYEIRVTN